MMVLVDFLKENFNTKHTYNRITKLNIHSCGRLPALQRCRHWRFWTNLQRHSKDSSQPSLRWRKFASKLFLNSRNLLILKWLLRFYEENQKFLFFKVVGKQISKFPSNIEKLRKNVKPQKPQGKQMKPLKLINMSIENSKPPNQCHPNNAPGHKNNSLVSLNGNRMQLPTCNWVTGC